MESTNQRSSLRKGTNSDAGGVALRETSAMATMVSTKGQHQEDLVGQLDDAARLQAQLQRVDESE